MEEAKGLYLRAFLQEMSLALRQPVTIRDISMLSHYNFELKGEDGAWILSCDFCSVQYQPSLEKNFLRIFRPDLLPLVGQMSTWMNREYAVLRQMGYFNEPLIVVPDGRPKVQTVVAPSEGVVGSLAPAGLSMSA